MVDEAIVRRRVREAIQAGEVPRRLPDQLLGGASTGAHCAFCGDSTEGGIEMELVFVGDEGERTFYAHPRCLWTFQREFPDLPGRRHRAPNQEANAAD